MSILGTPSGIEVVSPTYEPTVLLLQWRIGLGLAVSFYCRGARDVGGQSRGTQPFAGRPDPDTLCASAAAQHIVVMACVRVGLYLAIHRDRPAERTMANLKGMWQQQVAVHRRAASVHMPVPGSKGDCCVAESAMSATLITAYSLVYINIQQGIINKASKQIAFAGRKVM